MKKDKKVKWKKDECIRCGCPRFVIKQTQLRTGKYCAECGKWARWIDNGQEAKRIIESELEKEGSAFENQCMKIVVNRAGIKKIRCSNCKCLLYTSNAEPPAGQFDLINALYCPNCGKEFVDIQKTMRK